MMDPGSPAQPGHPLIDAFVDEHLSGIESEVVEDANTSGGGGPKESGGNPRRILLAIGSRRLAERLVELLEQSGWQAIHELRRGRVIELALDPGLAAAVLPWHRRDRRGRRLVETIRELGTPGRPLLIAACRGTRAARAALDAGVDEILLRPRDPRLVAERIIRTIDAARDRRLIAELHGKLEQARRTGASEPSGVQADVLDDLTGLPNRTAFERALLGVLTSGVGPRRRAAVLLFDIDRFRNINRSLGRSRANLVLQEFAQRLARCVHPEAPGSSPGAGTASTIAARLGGDQFAILLSGLRPDVDLEGLAERFRRELTEDYVLSDRERVHLTASIGVALAPNDATDAHALIDCAEQAMEAAADVGDGVVRFHGDSATRWTDRHVRLAGLLVGALGCGELAVHYQPIVASGSGRIVAAEALLRWNSPELGLVSPGEFVPIAEERGLMDRLGAWVLEESCRVLHGWLNDGVPPLRMAVNVSIGQLVQPRFSDTVRGILARYALDPSLLELEISERGVLRDDPQIRRQLEDVRELGCRLAIDDFGTGNSGVAYLKRFPVTTLKIDRSLVSGVLRSGEDAAITTAITAMARKLQLSVVAEGIETEAQRRFLEVCGCDELQGYLFSRPVTAGELRHLVERSAEPEPALS